MAYNQKGFPMIKGSSLHKSALKDTYPQRTDYTKHVSDDPHKHEKMTNKEALKEMKRRNKPLKEQIKGDINKVKEEIQSTKNQIQDTKDTITETKGNIKKKAENVKKEGSPIKKGKVGKWWEGLDKGQKAMLIGGGAIGAGLLVKSKADKKREEIGQALMPGLGGSTPTFKKSPNKVHKSGHKSKEQKARDKYYKKGEKIEDQLNSAKKPGKTTTLGKVKYNSLVNRLEKMYRGMYPDPDESNVRGTFGPWKPYKRK